MKFSDDFINEAKELYPTWTELHWALDNGSGIVGRMLCDGESGTFSCQQILDASSIEMLHQKAMLKKRRLNLYAKYLCGTCYDKAEERGKV